MLHPNYRVSCETSQVSCHITGFLYRVQSLLVILQISQTTPRVETHSVMTVFTQATQLKHYGNSALAVLSATLSSKTFDSQSKTLISLKIIFILKNVIVASESIADKCTWQIFHSLKINFY